VRDIIRINEERGKIKKEWRLGKFIDELEGWTGGGEVVLLEK
jgi:hypothetical protein